MAIEAKELMVGNYLVCGKGRIVKVDDIGDTGINIQWYHELTGYEYTFKELSPISLSTDIL